MQHILLNFFTDAEIGRDFNLKEWSTLFRLARENRLLARVAWEINNRHMLDVVPEKARWWLESAWITFLRQQRALRWEVNRVGVALRALPVHVPVILLKGGAYMMRHLPLAMGRPSVDLDILIPEPFLHQAETALNIAGWLPDPHKDEYDEAYYRKWMHEIPPLTHFMRGSVLDVHHTILPPTGRIRIDPDSLFRNSIPLNDFLTPEDTAYYDISSRFRILSPPDMILHCAAHLFQDGELNHCFRDFLDLYGMFRFFGVGTNSIFENDLWVRAGELQLRTPLFYALRYAQKMFQLTVSEPLQDHLRRYDSGFHTVFRHQIMDLLVPLAVIPDPRGRHSVWMHSARSILYIRSHYLRMPMGMLMKHLFTKWRKRNFHRL